MFSKQEKNDPDTWTTQQVSHISLYYFGDGVTPTCESCTDIPEPGSLAVLAAGLFAIRLFRRKS